MIVTLAVIGPLTQSVSLTGGKIDSAVGPGVGFWVITVQPESGKRAAWVGTVRMTVGAGRVFVVAVAVGVACTWGIHPDNPTAMSKRDIRINLRIYFSMGKYIVQFYQ
jgi:hypothetical protein